MKVIESSASKVALLIQTSSAAAERTFFSHRILSNSFGDRLAV